MAQFQDYAKITEEQKEEFYRQQKEKGLGNVEERGGGFDFLSVDLLNEKFQTRKNTTDFAARTKYYFEDADMMQAKAERYRNLADNGRDIEAHARCFSNHSAGKRKKAANAAADAFDHAAELEENYREQMGSLDPLTRFQRKKEIMEARLLGMKKAAEVKSTSKENETYRMLKAEISCISILKEQAEELLKDESSTERIMALKDEIEKLSGDLVAAEQKLEKIIPSPVKQWKEHFFSGDRVQPKFEEWKNENPALTKEDARINLILHTLHKDVYSEDFEKALKNLEKNKMYENYTVQKAGVGRMCFAMKPVLRDEQGRPINSEELRKDQHNQRWMSALSEGNIEEKNKVLLEQFHHIEKMRIPSPRELQERGVDFFFEKDPVLFYEILTRPLVFDNLKDFDSFAKEYEEKNPVFRDKLNAMAALATLYATHMNGKHMMDKEALREGGVSKDAPELLAMKASDEILEDRMEAYKREYDTAYKDPYGVGIDGVVLGYLNKTEKESLKLFAERHSDEYDREMRRRIKAPTEGALGQELLKKRSADDLSDLTGQAYEALHGATIAKSKRMQRAETAVEKKKLQMALRNRMENALIERQIAQAKTLTRELYVKNKNGELQQNGKMIKALQDRTRDSVSLQFAMDWTDIGEYPALLEQLNPEKKSITVSLNLILASEAISKLDLHAFEYKSDREFVAGLQENYRWIRRADSLRAYYRMAKEQNLVRNSSEFASSTLEAQLQLFEEMKADYDARIAMMNSPYYALLANADVAALSDAALKQKAEALKEDHAELAEFLKNYRFLKSRRAVFQKGQSAEKRYRILLEQKQEEEASRQKAMWQKIEELGMDPDEDQDIASYQKKIGKALMKKAKENVPKVDGAFVKQKKPFLNNVVGNLRETELKTLETWMEEILSDENKLKENGFTESEITELKALRQNSYQARWLVEVQEYFNDNLGKDWNKESIESPEINGKVDEATHEMLLQFFNNYLSVLYKLGLPENLPDDASAELYYSMQLGNITRLLAAHNIMYTKDWEQVLNKAKEKAKKIADEELEKESCPVVTIGGKKYPLLKQMNSFTKYDGKQIGDKDRASLEEKLNRVKELYILINATNIINVEKKTGVYTTEFMALQNGYAEDIKKLTGEIDKLLKA